MQTETPSKPVAVLVLWAALTVALFGASGLLFWRDYSFQQRAVQGEGIVSDSRTSWVNGEQRFDSTVNWTDHNGVQHSFGVSGSYPKGSSYEFLYDPEHPDDHRNAWPSWLIPLFIACGFSYAFWKVMRRPGVGTVSRHKTLTRAP